MATLSNNASTPSNGNNGSSNGSSHAPKQRHMLSVSPDYCVNGIQVCAASRGWSRMFFLWLVETIVPVL